jgi:hypothetical protein
LRTAEGIGAGPTGPATDSPLAKRRTHDNARRGNATVFAARFAVRWGPPAQWSTRAMTGTPTPSSSRSSSEVSHELQRPHELRSNHWY